MVRSVAHRRASRGWLAGLAAGAVALVSAGVLHAQQGQLQLFVGAVDATGKPVNDLKPEEILMTENGAPGKVVTLEPHKLPVKLTLAVDNGPESPNALSHYRTGLTGLVEALPADVEVTLITMAPAPRTFLKPTTNRADILKAINNFGPDTSENPRFTETMVEYAERLEKDFKDKKLNYSPVIVMVSTGGAEVSSLQLDSIEKGMKLLAGRGGKVFVAITSTRPGDVNAIQDLTVARQGVIGKQLAQMTGGKFEALPMSMTLTTLLPEWGKTLANVHTKQTNQFRVVIQRPGNATGALNNPNFQIARPGLTGFVSADGRVNQ